MLEPHSPALLIRPARIEDAPGMARVHVDGWRHAYRGIVPQNHLDGLTYEARTQRWQAILSGEIPPEKNFVFQFVAVNSNGQILGLTGGGPERENDLTYLGELYGIYVHPESQGLGIGRALATANARTLISLGFHNMLLWVLRDNSRARAFYARLGGRTYKEKTVMIGGAELVEVAYVWDDLTAFCR